MTVITTKKDPVFAKPRIAFLILGDINGVEAIPLAEQDFRIGLTIISSHPDGIASTLGRIQKLHNWFEGFAMTAPKFIIFLFSN